MNELVDDFQVKTVNTLSKERSWLTSEIQESVEFVSKNLK